METEYGYLQHGAGTAGPFRTERVAIKHEAPGNWLARFEGRWRKVHVSVSKLWIVYLGEKIDIRIEGV